MLHVFFGNTVTGVRNKAHACAETFLEAGVRLVNIDADSFVSGMLVDAAGSASLFGERMVYVLDTPSADTLFNEEVADMVQALAESQNVFIVIEGTLLAAAKKMYGAFATTLEECKEEKARPFNVFALADSLSRKDKKTLWLGLCEAKAAGLSSEEIIGTLWWQLKTLRLAQQTATAAQAGMKDFPYSKAKRALAHFTEGELETLSRKLLLVYHKGHQGEVDIDLSLEQWALRI